MTVKERRGNGYAQKILYTYYENGEVKSKTATIGLSDKYGDILQNLDGEEYRKVKATHKVGIGQKVLRLFILITYVLIIIMAVSSANLPGIRVPLVSLIPVTTLCGMFYDGPSMLGPKEYTAYLLEQEAGLCLEDFTYLQNVLTECYSFKAWDALKYLESIYLANFQKYDKGTLHFVYTMRNGTAYWEGIMLDGKHVLKAS